MKIDVKQISSIDGKLRDLLTWLERYTGLEFTITSLHRIDDPGVHGTRPTRGADLRMRNEAVGMVIETIINANWIYDCDRVGIRCAKLHGLGANLHLHLQVHPKTWHKV